MEACVRGVEVEGREGDAAEARPGASGGGQRESLRYASGPPAPCGSVASLRKWSRTLFLVIAFSHPRKVSPASSFRNVLSFARTAWNTS